MVTFSAGSLSRRHYTLLGIVVTLVIWVFYHLGGEVPPPVIDPSYGVLRESSSSSKYAIATFLNGDDRKPSYEEDYYFIATRILTYQILHNNDTKCARDIPFLVAVTSTVSQEKRDQLTKDGAIVVPVEDIPLRWWIRTTVPRWKDQFTKLRLLQLTEYDRILFIDADGILTRPIDGIFDEEIARVPAKTKFLLRSKIRGDEAQMPAEYIFTARSDNQPNGRRKHPIPPIPTKGFSAGFWLAAPSDELFAYLISIMDHWLRFNPNGMEQSLLNYAFRREGAMPWGELNYQWSATW
jgi:alpha-N-acetylglucosamine transferase